MGSLLLIPSVSSAGNMEKSSENAYTITMSILYLLVVWRPKGIFVYFCQMPEVNIANQSRTCSSVENTLKLDLAQAY